MNKKHKKLKSDEIEFFEVDDSNEVFDDNCLACLDPKGELDLIGRLTKAKIKKERVIN